MAKSTTKAQAIEIIDELEESIRKLKAGEYDWQRQEHENCKQIYCDQCKEWKDAGANNVCPDCGTFLGRTNTFINLAKLQIYQLREQFNIKTTRAPGKKFDPVPPGVHVPK